MNDAMLIAAAACAYMPLALTFVLYARAKRYPYALQVFTDSLRKVGGQVTTASFLLAFPAVYLLLFDEHLTAQIEWKKSATAALFLAWLTAYPLTLVIFHALRSGLQRTEPYALPYSAAANMGYDILKHTFLATLFFIGVYAGGQTLHPEKLMILKNTIAQIRIAS